MATKEQSHLYEGMYIISATLSEDARNKAFDRITDGISKKKGDVKKVHPMGRKKFAYPIEGKREGYYYLVYFEAPPKAIKEMWKEYHLNEDLIRFMHIRTEEVQETIEFKPLVEE